MWPRGPQQGSHGRKASRDQVEPLPPACPDSWPTAAPSCPAAPGPEPSAARLGCEHSGGEGAGGGERSLSAPLRVPLPRAPSSGGRARRTGPPAPASSENKAGRDLPARLQLQGQSVRGNSDLWGGLVLRALCVPSGGTQTLRVGALAQGRRLLHEGWWGDVADAPVSPAQRSWEWEPLPGSQRPRHTHGAPK